MRSRFIPVAVAVVLGLQLGGCAVSAPEYSWYHPQGGELLFAFDASECETEVVSAGRDLGVDTEGPFFKCMYQRGYALVGNDGQLAGPAIATRAEPQSLSQQ